jgi:hypothetical protein
VLDMPLSRIRQARDVIWERRDEDWRRELRVREVVVQALIGSIYGAQGSKDAARVAESFTLVPPDPDDMYKGRKLPSTEAVVGLLAGAG